MKTQGSQMEDGGWPAQSVLECGSPLSPLPLLDGITGSGHGGIRPNERSSPCESARGLAHSKTWRKAATLAVFLAIAFAVLSSLTQAQAQSPGTALWTNRYQSPFAGTDRAVAATVDGSGNVIVTGVSNGSGDRSDYATVKYSGEGVPMWTNRYNGPENNSDSARAIAVDAAGNVFVTGDSFGTGTDYDYATIGYSGDGVPLWTNRYDGPGNTNDHATAVAVDRGGNVVVTGYSYGNGTDYDYATIKYSGAGLPLWTNRYNGPGNGEDQATAVAVDPEGNVFVTGDSRGDSASDYATIKYSSAGVPLWTNRYDGPLGSADLPTGVAVDGSGDVIVTGYSLGSSGTFDYATIKYSGAGLPLWTNRYNGPGNGHDQVTAVAVDGSGNVFVTGNSSRGSDADYATLCYSGAGAPLWTNRYNGPANGGDFANALAVDTDGNVFVTGAAFSNASSRDYVTIQYSGAGVPLWTNRYNGTGNFTDEAFAVVVDRNGNVFVTGESWGGGDSDYATIKYSSSSAHAPSLTIARTTTNTVAVAWPKAAADWNLEFITNLTTTGTNDWTLLPPPYPANATDCVVIEPAPLGNKFYRLRKP